MSYWEIFYLLLASHQKATTLLAASTKTFHIISLSCYHHISLLQMVTKMWYRVHLWRDGRERSESGVAKYESLTENVDECPSPKSTHLCLYKCELYSVRKLCVSKYPVNWSPLPATDWADLVSFEQTKSSTSRHRLNIMSCSLPRVNQFATVTTLKKGAFSPFPLGITSCFICPQTGRKVMSCFAESALGNLDIKKGGLAPCL